MSASLSISLVSLAFASIALGLNFLTFRDRRRQDRRDLFLKMHERLVDAEIKRGRHLLWERVSTEADARTLRTSTAEDDKATYQSIDRALAMFDVFAMYVERGYIPRELALEEWGHSFARTYQRAQPFLRDRDKGQPWQPWPHLRTFAADCTSWHEQHYRPAHDAGDAPLVRAEESVDEVH